MCSDLRIAFAAIAISAWWLCAAAHAQAMPENPAAPASQFNYDAFKVPYSTPTYDVAPPPGKFSDRKPDFRKTDPDGAGSQIALPNKMDLGKYQLELNVKRNDANSRPQIDSGETANINSTMPQQKQSPVPNYFGLTLTAPTH